MDLMNIGLMTVISRKIRIWLHIVFAAQAAESLEQNGSVDPMIAEKLRGSRDSLAHYELDGLAKKIEDEYGLELDSRVNERHYLEWLHRQGH